MTNPALQGPDSVSKTDHLWYNACVGMESMANKSIRSQQSNMTKKANKPTVQNRNPAIKIDLDFRDLLPPLTEKGSKTLEESIRREGLREPLVIWAEKGILVDGHNRYDICKKHKIKYAVRHMSFESREAAKLWIWGNQAGRRNMTMFQRIVASLKLKDIIAAEAKKKQKESGGAVCQKVDKPKEDKPVHTYTILAEMPGVSHTMVRKAEDILEKHHEGVISKDEMDALFEGKVKVSNVHNKYCVTKPAKPAPVSTDATDADAVAGSDGGTAVPHALISKPKPKPGQTVAEQPRQISDAIQRAKASTRQKMRTKLPEHLLEQVDTMLLAIEDIEQVFSEIEHRNYVYEMVAQWANQKKDELIDARA
jgi:hypothetical protein